MALRRRDLLRLLTATALTGLVPRISRAADDQSLYDVPRFGNVRVLHMTDTHAQLEPVYFREPSINLGVGAMLGRPPHLVGTAFLRHFGIEPGSRRAHALTYLDFAEAARRYGRLGGFAHLKTLVERLRAQAGPGRSLLLDGGDLMQGSGLSAALAGADMVAAANLLGIDAITGHWEFTLGETTLRANIAALKGEFLAQNVFLTAEAAFNDAQAFDPPSGRVFKPATVRDVGGCRLAVIGQAFPYVPVAHPRRFVPDWTFGIRAAELQTLVDALRAQKADAVLLLSHNGMDVDLKLAGAVRGIDVVLGGHTHDAVPQPTLVANPGGKTLVTNAGCAGKFLAVLDLDVGKGRLNDARYRLLPVFADLIEPDPAMTALIGRLRAPHARRLDERLATAGELLYRRGNFNGPMDQLICEALRHALDAEIALSPGFRFGNAVLPGQPITMADVLSSTAITYPEVYVREMTGAQIRATLEDVCDNLFNPDPYYQQGGDMVRVGGLDYTCAPAEGAGRRIGAVTRDDGTPLDPGRTYRVAGWASVEQRDGRAISDVLADYLRSEKTARVKRGNRVSLTGVAGNPGVGTQG